MWVKVIIFSGFFGIIIIGNTLALQNNNSASTEELINQQSEHVRHIIAAEKRKIEQDDTKLLTKKDKSIVAIEEQERLPSLEELKLKCQHFSRLFGNTQYMDGNFNLMEPGIISSSTILPEKMDYHLQNNNNNNRPFSSSIIDVTRRPIFIRNKPTYLLDKTMNNGAGGGGFYITNLSSNNEPTRPSSSSWNSTPKYSTTSSSTTTTTTTTTEPASTTIRPKLKIKYTKFEPVILQKTILTDGRIMYHWHKSLPTAPIDITIPPQLPVYEFPNFSQKPIEIPSSSSFTTTTTEPSSTSTTTKPSNNNYWLYNLFSGGSSHEEEQTTTTEAAENASQENPLPEIKPAHIKLVVPIQYDDIDSNLASQNNKFNSAPTLQVIKTIGVPQNIPRYSLGNFPNNGYGLSPLYGANFMNYQPYNYFPLKKREENEKSEVAA